MVEPELYPESYVQKLITRESKLRDALPYAWYFPESAVFKQKDGSLGAVFEVTPVDFEMNINDLRSMFTLPSGSVLQILYDQFSSFDKSLRAVVAGKPRLMKRMFISVQSAPRGSGNIQHFNEIKRFSKLISGFVSQSKVPLRRLNDVEFIHVLRRYLNPKTFQNHFSTSLDKNLLLAEQLVFHEPLFYEAGMISERVKSRVITVTTPLKYLPSGGIGYVFDFQFPFRLSFNYSFPDRRQLRDDFKRNKISEALYSSSAKDHERLLHLTFNVIVEGQSDRELEARVNQVISRLRNQMDCEAVTEQEFGLELYLSSLPLNFKTDCERHTERFIGISQSSAIQQAPVYEKVQERNRPFGLCVTREGDLISMDSLARETQGHAIIVSDSEDKKKEIVHDFVLAAQYGKTPAPVFIIRSSSHDIFGEIAGHFDVDRYGAVPTNPFSGIMTSQRVEFLTRFLLVGLELVRAFRPLGKDAAHVISRAIELVAARKVQDRQDAVLSIREIVEEMTNLPSGPFHEYSNSTIEALMYGLMPFYGNGPYAGLLEEYWGEAYPHPDSIHIYDLRQFREQRILGALGAMAITEDIRRIMSLPQWKNRGGYLLFDDLSILGGGTSTGDHYLSDYSVKARELGLHMVSLAPKMENYFELYPGAAFWNEADHFFFLRNGEKTLEYLHQHWDYLDVEKMQEIASLRALKGEFQDIFYTNRAHTNEKLFRYFPSSRILNMRSYSREAS